MFMKGPRQSTTSTQQVCDGPCSGLRQYPASARGSPLKTSTNTPNVCWRSCKVLYQYPANSSEVLFNPSLVSTHQMCERSSSTLQQYPASLSEVPLGPPPVPTKSIQPSVVSVCGKLSGQFMDIADTSLHSPNNERRRNRAVNCP